MSIQRKIEEIRRQPEHVRMRYVWIFTAVSMAFVVAIWVFSLAAPTNQERESTEEIIPGEILEGLKEETDSLREAAKNAKGAMEKVPMPGSDSGLLGKDSLQDRAILDDQNVDVDEGFEEEVSRPRE